MVCVSSKPPEGDPMWSPRWAAQTPPADAGAGTNPFAANPFAAGGKPGENPFARRLNQRISTVQTSKKLGGTPTEVLFESFWSNFHENQFEWICDRLMPIHAQSLAIFIGEEDDLEIAMQLESLRIWRTPSTYPQPGRLTDSQVSKSAEWRGQEVFAVTIYQMLFNLFNHIA